MRIGVIGHFGGSENFTDGQTVKTKTLYDALKRRIEPDVKIVTADTFYAKRNPLRFTWELVRTIFSCNQIIVLLSSRGRQILFPVFYYCSKCLKKDIFHYAIGGRLYREVTEKKNYGKYVGAFRANWVESTELANNLQNAGIDNAVYLPNFKHIEPISTVDLPNAFSKPYAFCTFSRVMPEKGIDDAIDAVMEVNRRCGLGSARLDIYGPIEAGYEESFNSHLEKTNGVCRYCGVIPPNNSVRTLKDYYALLFPTHWRHEGIPGTIVDALSSGVPVIARRWQYCDEMLTHGSTGYVYDFEQPEKLADWISFAIEHKVDVIGMKKNCLEASEKYGEATVMDQILCVLQQK